MPRPNLRIAAELVPLIERLLVEGAFDGYVVEHDGLSVDGMHCYVVTPKGKIEANENDGRAMRGIRRGTGDG